MRFDFLRKRLELKIIVSVLCMFLAGTIIAIIAAVLMARKNFNNSIELSLNVASKFIEENLMGALVLPDPNLSKLMVQDARFKFTNLKDLGGIEDMRVLNKEGGYAYEKTEPLKEDILPMKYLQETKQRYVYKDSKKFVYYHPLENSPVCMVCHMKDGPVLGAVKVSFSSEKEYKRIVASAFMMIIAVLIAAVILGFVIWYMMRRLIIEPVKSIEGAAVKLSDGDLSFEVGVKGEDEVARLTKSMKGSIESLGRILLKVKDISTRLSSVASSIEKSSGKMVEGTRLEAEAVSDISSAVEELNASISDINEGTEELAASSEETAAAMDEIATSIGEVTSSTRDLFSSVESTSSSIEELSGAIKEIAESADNLSSATDETVAAIEQMTSSVKAVDQNSKESAKLSEKVMTDASTFGMASIEKTMEGMNRIKVSVEKTNEFITKLGGRSEEIGKILNVIDDITDQTTLLALNAAILAAQAGEHGKGFSVVADEIKDLAERTAFSTQEISVLIQAVQQEVGGSVQAMGDGMKSVEEGLKLSKEAFDSLKKILDSSKQSSQMAFSIERATSEQAQSIKLVSEAMERIRNMTDMIANATSEQSKGVNLIMTASEKMRDVAQQVKSATEEQAVNSKHISKAVEVISDKSQQISKAINEQKLGSNQIWSSIEKIKDIPKSNRDLAFNMNSVLKGFIENVALIDMEIRKFRFSEQSSAVLKFGAVPIGTSVETSVKFTPLINYLSQKMNETIDYKFTDTYDDVVEDLGKNVIQIACMNPTLYVRAHSKYGVRVIATMLRKGRPYHRGVIIARADSKVNSISDLKGKMFAFGDVSSTLGYVAPRLMLLDEGIDLGDLHYYNSFTHHEDVIKAVLSGEFDAGAVTEDIARSFEKQGIKFLKETEYLPGFNICVNDSLGSERIALCRSALTHLDDSTPEGRTILGSIGNNVTGFVEAKDEDYARIRDMLLRLKMV